MLVLSLNDTQSISGGFSNSFLAGMKGDENFHCYSSTEALLFTGLLAATGLPAGPAGVMVMGGFGFIVGCAAGLNEYALGQNYVEANRILHG